MQKAQPASIGAEALLMQYARTGAPEIRDKIVEIHLYIAEIIARKFSGRGVDYDDLYQVAALALFKAIDRFDITKGIKFASFVTPTMVGEVKNYFRDRSRVIRLPRKGMQLAQMVRRARSDLEQELGRSPRVDELARHLDLSEDEILEGLEMSSASSMASLDAQIGEDEDSSPLSKFIGASEQGFADFERNDMLKRAFSHLDERQLSVIRYRFFENLSQREVAQKMDISQMTVSRIERQALEILREHVHE